MGPVGPDGDLLIQNSEFGGELEIWAQDLAAYAAEAAEAIDGDARTFQASTFPGGFTLLISAGWGAGKTSCVRILRDRIFTQLREVSDQTWILDYIEVDAHEFEQCGASARKAITREIAGDCQILNRKTDRYLELISPNADIETDEMEVFDLLRARISAPSETLPQDTQINRCSLVVIDDLDRVASEFVRGALLASRAWQRLAERVNRDAAVGKQTAFATSNDSEPTPLAGSSDRINGASYFIFLFPVARNVLDRAATELGTRNEQSKETYTGEAAQKYIHGVIDVPQLLGSRARVAQFMARGLQRSTEHLDPSTLERLQSYLHTIASNPTDSNRTSPLAPIIEPFQSDSIRSIKARIARFIQRCERNGIAKSEVNQDADFALQATQATWPEWYKVHVGPFSSPAADLSFRCAHGILRSVILQPKFLAPEILPVSQLDLEHTIASTLIERLNLQVTDDAVADSSPANHPLTFLANWEIFPPETSILDQLPHDPEPNIVAPSESIITGTVDSVDSESSDLAFRQFPELPSDGTSDAMDQFESLYRLADLEVGRGNTSHAVELLSELRSSVEQAVVAGTKLTTYIAPILGNAAVLCESLGSRSDALLLHQAARLADPSHSNIMQNYADFLLDLGTADAAAEARSLLDDLASDPKHRDWKAKRTRALQTRLLLSSGEGTVQTVENLLNDSGYWNEPDSQTWLYSMRALPRTADGASLALRMTQVLVASESDSTVPISSALRAAADFCASLDDEWENIAIDIYRRLLLSDCGLDAEQVADTAHNMASLLATREQFQWAALRLWALAYPNNRDNRNTRRAFSRFLATELKVVAADIAEAVMRGEETDFDELVRKSPLPFTPLPSRFSQYDPFWDSVGPLKVRPEPFDFLSPGWSPRAI